MAYIHGWEIHPDVKFSQLDLDEKRRVLDAYERVTAEICALPTNWYAHPEAKGKYLRLNSHSSNIRWFIVGCDMMLPTRLQVVNGRARR